MSVFVSGVQDAVRTILKYVALESASPDARVSEFSILVLDLLPPAIALLRHARGGADPNVSEVQ